MPNEVSGWQRAEISRPRVEPHHLAGRGIQRRNRAVAGNHVQKASNHQRRVLIVGRCRRVGSCANFDRCRRLAPRDAKIPDRVSVDLIERRVFRARGRARIGPPFGARGCALREGAHAGRSQQGQTSRERDKPADDNCSTLHRCPPSWRLTAIQRPSLCFDTDIAAANRTASPEKRCRLLSAS